MAETAADVLMETLHDWGVEVIFGLPGDGINGLIEALRRRDHGRESLRMGSQESKSRLNRECSRCHYPDKGDGPCPSPMAGCTAIS